MTLFNRRRLVHIAGIGALASVAHRAVAQQTPRQSLSDDVSRAELLQYASSLDPTTRAFPRTFQFPADVSANATFGIDVSHYQGAIDWTSVAASGVAFAYVKATQGEAFFDGRFSDNWRALSWTSGVRRGAYHFMSANSDAASQAANFLTTVGTFRPTDLPPCLDLEWDFPRRLNAQSASDPVDRWGSLTAAEVIENALIWLKAVEAATARRPIIYTNTFWWRERIGTRMDLAAYPIWTADYSAFSRGQEKPRFPAGHAWKIWQLTDKGRVVNGAIGGAVDVNVFPGTAAEFEKWIS